MTDHLTLTDGWEPDLPVSDTLLRPLPFDRPGETLDAVEGFFDGHGSREAYVWSAWPTPDLRRRGWVLAGHPPLLLRPSGGPPPPPVPPGLRAERVLADGRLRLWVGYEDDRPVWMGTLFVDAGVAAFFLGVTLPEARRRGYWAAMAGVRLADEPDFP